MITKPYGLTFLKYTAQDLSREDMAQILVSAWTRSEAPHQDVNVTVNQLLRMFKQADPTCLMEQDEYIQFNTLDDTVTVYRGVTPHNAKSVKALSWSLDQETAEWFAPASMRTERSTKHRLIKSIYTHISVEGTNPKGSSILPI